MLEALAYHVLEIVKKLSVIPGLELEDRYYSAVLEVFPPRCDEVFVMNSTSLTSGNSNSSSMKSSGSFEELLIPRYRKVSR